MASTLLAPAMDEILVVSQTRGLALRDRTMS